MMKMTYCIALFYILFCLGAHNVYAEQEVFFDHQGVSQRVTYDLRIPPNTAQEDLLPVLVCVGGLPVIDGQYAQSNTQECMGYEWKQFADLNKVAILGVGFLFIPEDWPDKESYQYTQVWSGQAVLSILDRLKEDAPINPKVIYLYGVSAGAQFSVRFAQYYPAIAKAVTAHAAGGYDVPKSFIPTRLLLTVGDLDNVETRRRDMALEFTRLAKDLGIDIQLEIIPDIGHRQTLEQDRMSRRFLTEVMGGIR